MKPGRRDKPAFIQFTSEEFKLLQDYSYQMIEAYGLDTRIRKLKGKRKITFYSWDLDCLECVFSELIKECTKHEKLKLFKSIYKKIENGYEEISQSSKI